MTIQLNDISKNYRGKAALKGLSFTINKNEVVALIGNNGAGKTTTINIICNLIPFDGELKINGQRITSESVGYKAKTGVVFSEPVFIETLTAREYWEFAARFFDVSREDVSLRIKEMETLFELDSPDKMIKQLSAGQQQKVSIGAALIHNPELLILDEPFNSLDVKSREVLAGQIKRLKSRKTMLITSHDLDTVADLCDRYLVLDKGTLMLDLHKDEFTSGDELKGYLKSKLAKEALQPDLSWLGGSN